MKKKYFTKIASILSIVAGIMICILLVYLGTTENIEVFQSRQNTGYEKIEDYTCHVIEDAELPSGIEKEYSWRLEETPRGDTYLAFYVVHQYVEVSIDGETVYSLRTSEENQIGKTTGSNWVMIPLYPEDAGKEICVVTTPVYENYQNKTIDFLIGSRHEIYMERLKRDLPQLILGVMAILVGVFFLGMGIYNYWKNRQGGNVVALGVFSVMMGVWRLTDTRMTPLLFAERPVFLFYVSIASLMLGMVPLMKSMQKRLSRKSRIIFDCCIMLVSVVCILQLVIQILHVADLREILVVTHIMILISVITIVGCILYERLRYGKREKGHIGRKFSVVCVIGVVADIIAFYIKGNSSGLIFTLLAFLIYVICTGIVMIMDYKEQEEALASSRIAILISQMQPHFVFNSLVAIRALCQKDVDEAVETLDYFSKYLRGVMDSLTEKKCILFDKELEHVKNYLYIEHKRFGERLQVIYDIRETNFMIPALTVQPMVENAVRHGICKKREGGCIVISSYADAEDWIVEIADDGKGFDTKKQNNEDGTAVGIENVRNRLEMMCNGELVISSIPGKGTKVVIRIPKR